eukprot:CFRG1630T1
MLSKRMDNLGFTVIATCLTEEGAKALKKKASKRLKTIVFDLTNEKELADAIEKTKNICGQNGLYALVNNAGIADEICLEFQTMEAIRRVMEINFFAMVATTKGLLPLLRKSGQSPSGARVINVASAAGRIASPGFCGYSASKFAVESFSDSLRRELWIWGVTVSVIEPGFMKTPITSSINKSILAKRWNDGSVEAQDAYGREWMDEIAESPDKIQFLMQNPTMTVNEMEKCLMKAYPKSRYSCGWDAPFYILTSYLPAFVGDIPIIAAMPRPKTAIVKSLFSHT